MYTRMGKPLELCAGQTPGESGVPLNSGKCSTPCRSEHCVLKALLQLDTIVMRSGGSAFALRYLLVSMYLRC